jgi:hypothetical protein
MKKLILRIAIGVVVLAVLAAMTVHFFLDSAVKKAVETIGLRLTKVDVKLEGLSLSLLSGAGRIRGLVVGNPEGFKTPCAINVASASLALQPGSLLSDKVIVREVKIQGPEITLETGLHGSNLGRIQANLSAVGGADKQKAAKGDQPGKKLEVDEFAITGGKVRVSVVGLAGRSAELPLPDIILKDLGTGPEGITAGELADKVLSVVISKSIEVSASAIGDLGKQASGLTTGAGAAASNAAGKVSKGIGGLFKKSQ